MCGFGSCPLVLPITERLAQGQDNQRKIAWLLGVERPERMRREPPRCWPEGVLGKSRSR